MKINLSILAAIIAVAFSANAQAISEGGKEGHGGGVVVVGGHSFLRDLVDPATCDWTTIEDLMSSVKYFPQLIASIEQTHWYLADVVKREVNRIEGVCVTNGYLRNVTSKEDENLYTVHRAGTEQVAIRVHDTLFLSKPVFDRLDARNKAYTMLHEASHALIDENVPQRAMFLASFVATVRKNEISPMGRDKFALQIKGNQVHIIPNTGPIDSIQADYLMFAYSKNETEAQTAAFRLVKKMPTSLLRMNEFSAIHSKVANAQIELFDLIKTGNPDEIEKRMQAGADPNFHDTRASSESYLGLAIKRGDNKVIASILAAPGLVLSSRASGSDYKSPLEMALAQKNSAILRMLLAHPDIFRDANEKVGSDELIAAILYGDINVIGDFFKNPYIKKVINFPTTADALPLVTAAQLGRLDIVEAALNVSGIDVNADKYYEPEHFGYYTNHSTQTALIAAVEQKRYSVVARLIRERGLDPNKYRRQEGETDYTALQLAVLNAKVPADYEMLSELLALPNINLGLTVEPGPRRTSDYIGKTALDIAIERGDMRAVAAFLKCPKTVVNVDVLSRAFTSGRWKIARMLVESSKGTKAEDVEAVIWQDDKGNYWTSVGMAVLRKDQQLLNGLLKVPGVSKTANVYYVECQPKAVPYGTKTSEIPIGACSSHYDARRVARKFGLNDMYEYLNSIYPSKETCIGPVCF